MKILNNPLLNRKFNFIKTSKRFFKLMTPEECFVNMRNSEDRKDIQQCTMKPLPEASNFKCKNFYSYFINQY